MGPWAHAGPWQFVRMSPGWKEEPDGVAVSSGIYFFQEERRRGKFWELEHRDKEEEDATGRVWGTGRASLDQMGSFTFLKVRSPKLKRQTDKKWQILEDI